MTLLFIETPIFTDEIRRLLPEEEYRHLQHELLFRPDAGHLIPGSGGLRKLRWQRPGTGKRGGLRIIYYFDPPAVAYMLFPYKKNVQENLSPRQLKYLRNLIKEYLQ